MVLLALKALVSMIKGRERREGIGGYRPTCQHNNTLTVTMLPCQVKSTLPVTASKKYAMMQEMGEDIS